MQKADNKIYLFEQSSIPKAVATLAVPTVLSQLVMVLYNLADTFWVGMLNNAVQNAAVTLAAPVLLAFNAINNLFGVGSSSMMSRALGRKDYETVSRSSAFGFYCSIICGIIFSLLCTVFQNPLLVLLGADETTMQATREYMFWTVNCGAVPAILNVVMAYLVRSEGSAMHASIGTMSGCLLNIVLDPVFILPWGFDMGAGGAGLATFLSNCVACLYFFVLLFIKRGNTFVCIDPKKLSFQNDIVSGVCAVGIPASIQNLLNVTGMTILNNFSSSYGASAVAAIGICQKIYMVPMYISQGISQGVMPLISYTFSSNNIPRMKHAVSFARKAALTIIISVALLFFLFPGLLGRAVHEGRDHCGIWQSSAAPLLHGTSVFVHRFSGGGRLPGGGHGARVAAVCHPAQGGSGDSGSVYSQRAVRAVRTCFRPVLCGGHPCHCGDSGAAQAV